MSKVSRMLAGFQWIFTLISGCLIIFWTAYTFFKRGNLFTFILNPLMLIVAIYALTKAQWAETDTKGYQVAQGLLCLMHLAGFAFGVWARAPLLPGPDLFEPILERGINLNSLFWLGHDLTALGLLIGAITGIVPLFMSLHPTIRSKL